jgi:hypothetical protein
MLMTFSGIHPIDALFWTAVLNGYFAAPLLMPIMRVANSLKFKLAVNSSTSRWPRSPKLALARGSYASERL